MTASSNPPPQDIEPPSTPLHTPLQVHFLSRLAHLAALCYYARREPAAAAQLPLVQHALRATIDDCFDAGLEAELLTLLDDDELLALP